MAVSVALSSIKRSASLTHTLPSLHPLPPKKTFSLFHDSNAGTYIWTQLILGVVFLAYFILQCVALCQAKVLDLW